MYSILPLNRETVPTIQPLYEAFCDEAQEKYHWDTPPIPYDVLIQALSIGMVNGYVIESTAENGPIGFMLYRFEEHRAIEINLIYLPDDAPHKTIFDKLMHHFISEIRERPGWDVVSYPMLGAQAQFIRFITWYGFKPVGQAIVKFDFLDELTIQILQKQTLEPLPPGYTLDSWQPQYAGAVAHVIHEAFSQASDALWDPRFRTDMGARKVVHLVTSGEMGKHHPACTTVLLKDGTPVGFCYLIQASPTEGNIPLIGVLPSEKRQGFSRYLLKDTIIKAIKAMVDGKIDMVAIHATLDTDNFPAIRMYRRMGFRETNNYAHVYLTAERAQTVQPGLWC